MLRQSARSTEPPFQPHFGVVALQHSFTEVHKWLQKKQSVVLQTDAHIAFEARYGVAEDGRPVARFFQRRHEYGRVYACCWRRHYNCNRTPVGEFSTALDRALSF